MGADIHDDAWARIGPKPFGNHLRLGDVKGLAPPTTDEFGGVGLTQDRLEDVFDK